MTPLAALFIDTVIKSSIILGVTSGIALSLRRRSASLRHLVWTAGIWSALSLPLLGLVLPAWQPAIIALPVHSRAAETAPPTRLTAPMPTAATPSTVIPETATRVSRLSIVFIVWILGAAAAVLLLLVEFARLARVAVHAKSVRQQSWRHLVREVSDALHLKRDIRLIRNPDTSILGTWGTLHPRVLLPRESASWSGERMRIVLGHELAHVKRNDWIIQIVAETARAIHWFNPLFWIACSQLRRESEHACDDTAMGLGVDGPTYASHILDLARMLKHSGQPGSAALAMASTSNLERRLIAMLNPSLNRHVATKGTIAIVSLLALGLTLPLAAMRSPSPAAAAPTAPAITLQTTESAVPVKAAALAPVSPILPASHPEMKKQLALIVAAPEPLQVASGILSGTVVDQLGARIPGVSVTLVNESNIQTRYLTNDSGIFNVDPIAPGIYSLKATLPNFKTTSISRVEIVPGQRSQLALTMTIGLAMVMDISSDRPAGVKCVGVWDDAEAAGAPFTDANCPAAIANALTPKTAAPDSSADAGISMTMSPIATSPASPQANANRTPIRVGGDVKAGNVTFNPKPAYPAEARNKGIEGVVVLSGVVGTDGHIRTLKVLSSTNSVFNDSTTNAVQQWTCKPTLLDGQPIEVITTISANYGLGR